MAEQHGRGGGSGMDHRDVALDPRYLAGLLAYGLTVHASLSFLFFFFGGGGGAGSVVRTQSGHGRCAVTVRAVRAQSIHVHAHAQAHAYTKAYAHVCTQDWRREPRCQHTCRARWDRLDQRLLLRYGQLKQHRCDKFCIRPYRLLEYSSQSSS